VTWLSPTRWILLAVVFAALTLGVWRLDVSRQAIGEARADAAWTAKVKIQKAEAVLLLDTERTKVAQAERTLRDFKDKQEIQDGKNRTKVVGLEHRLRAAAAVNAGRLRDPHAERCRSGGDGPQSPVTASPGNSAVNPPEGTGLLSVQLSELLFELTREADEVNLAYASCRADAMSIREATK